MTGYCHSTDMFTVEDRTLPLHWILGQVDLQHISENDNEEKTPQNYISKLPTNILLKISSIN
jgi:hypothetical protein